MKQKDLRPGDILLFCGTTLVGRLICLFTRSEYCHAAMIGPDGQVLEMLSRGGAASTVESQARYKIDVFRAKTDDADLPRRASINMERNINGVRYGWGHAFLAWLSFFLRPARKECKRHGLMCSQAVSLAYRQAGLDPCVARLDWQTLPGHLALSPHFEILGRMEF